MPIDGNEDVVIATLAKLSRAAIESEIGSDAVRVVFEDPRDLQNAGSAALPALCVYRHSETRKRISSASVARNIVVAFEYTMPAASMERRVGRWPTLPLVWGAVSDVCCAGHHPNVNDDADVFALASIDVYEDTARVEYGLAPSGGDSYGMFRARLTVEHVPENISASDLYKFLGLDSAFDIATSFLAEAYVDEATADTPGQPGVSTGEGPVATDVDGHPDGLPEPP